MRNTVVTQNQNRLKQTLVAQTHHVIVLLISDYIKVNLKMPYFQMDGDSKPDLRNLNSWILLTKTTEKQTQTLLR